MLIPCTLCSNTCVVNCRRCRRTARRWPSSARRFPALARNGVVGDAPGVAIEATLTRSVGVSPGRETDSSYRGRRLGLVGGCATGKEIAEDAEERVGEFAVGVAEEVADFRDRDRGGSVAVFAVLGDSGIFGEDLVGAGGPVAEDYAEASCWCWNSCSCKDCCSKIKPREQT
ncbi:uncharacterized protein LOC112348027 isoform X2 [Selaginella moellendorffii]|uniref:uncharacterized protein LOC112348027 isoform X2 n=1 Tax=Selaginella moellendorffii TaxID=88036 RepID=UPI000D1C7E2E|nr:uncharacterized protein LOC112348027 isoform X2 [Selaginella moellendorffii]|eukprot:XP_024535685.1 uncharacterized protein LOC112348027 isoform X2 [Selaginella moellendorffii]